MERIGIRELRQNASRYLAMVKAGETVEVTDRTPVLLTVGAGSRRHADQCRAARCRACGTAVIYLDSSALMKLVRREEESAALTEWLSVR